MTLYQVRITAAADRQMRRLSKTLKARILARIESLAIEPLPAGVKKLAGDQNTYRIRVGDYRIIYEIHGGLLTVFVVKVAHRGEVYR